MSTSNNIEMREVQNGVFIAPVAETVEPKNGLVEKVKAAGAAAVETAKEVGAAFVNEEANKKLQGKKSAEIAEAKEQISTKIKTGLETLGNKYYEVLSMPIAPIANLKTKEFTPDENASGLTNFVKKAINADVNLAKTIAVGSEKFAREVGSKTYTVIDQGLSYFTNLLECVSLGNLGRLIQKTLAIVISAIVRAVLQTVSQIAQVVPVALFLGGCVVAAVAAIKLAQEAITGTILLATVVKQNKDIQDLKAENAALRQLNEEQANVNEIHGMFIKNMGTRMQIVEETVEAHNEDLETLFTEEEAAPAVATPTVATPTLAQSRRKKAAYTLLGLGTLGTLAIAAFNRQAVADAAVSFGTAALNRAAPYGQALLMKAAQYL